MGTLHAFVMFIPTFCGVMLAVVAGSLVAARIIGFDAGAHPPAIEDLERRASLHADLCTAIRCVERSMPPPRPVSGVGVRRQTSVPVPPPARRLSSAELCAALERETRVLELISRYREVSGDHGADTSLLREVILSMHGEVV